jgi:putative acyl-CoA dehydrogenase
MMRAALDSALHHARHREAFGKRLDAHPLMANVLADLALETQAATLLAFRLALAFDRSAAGDAREAELQRILTPIAKYWLCKRVTPVALEAMECLGGNGYVEESGAARLYREAPLNGIWEGSANVICLDVLRALNRSGNAFSALVDEIAAAGDPRIRQASDRAAKSLADPATAEPGARSIVEALAICMQASLMKRFSDPGAAEAFCASRLEASCGGRTLGTLAAGADFGAIVEGARLRM